MTCYRCRVGTLHAHVLGVAYSSKGATVLALLAITAVAEPALADGASRPAKQAATPAKAAPRVAARQPSTVIERPRGRPRETPREPDDKPPEPMRPSRRAPPKEAAPEPTDKMLGARLSFLEDRIGTQRKHAEIWWGTWLSFYTMGAIVQGARASDAENPADQADLWISTAKATFGVASYMADPFRGIEDFEPLPTKNMGRARKEERVREGERILVHNAEQTHKFGPWYAHIINIGINGLGGAIVAIGFDDPRTGLISAGIGAAVGEVAIFTSPWEADDDLEEYKARFGRGRDLARAPPSTPTVEWKVQPTGNGALLVGSF